MEGSRARLDPGDEDRGPTGDGGEDAFGGGKDHIRHHRRSDEGDPEGASGDQGDREAHRGVEGDGEVHRDEGDQDDSQGHGVENDRSTSPVVEQPARLPTQRLSYGGADAFTLPDGLGRQATVSEHQLELFAEHHSGPLPPARQLAEYNEVLPGLADRIVRMAELEQQHRHEVEYANMALPYVLARRGQTLGLAAMVFFLAFAGFLAYRGAPGWAALVAGIDIAAIIALFVAGREAKPDPADEDTDHST